VGSYRYSSDVLDSAEAFDLTNLKEGGRIYFQCINTGFEMYDVNTGMPANYVECDGTSFSPSVADLECRGTILLTTKLRSLFT